MNSQHYRAVSYSIILNVYGVVGYTSILGVELKGMSRKIVWTSGEIDAPDDYPVNYQDRLTDRLDVIKVILCK